MKSPIPELLLYLRRGLVLLAAGWMGPWVAPADAAPEKPNVLLILADDMGYSDLGCYGSEIQTPNLDGLAKNGLRFTQFYNTTRCWPTRGSLLTGYYAQQIRRDAVPGIPSGGRGTRPPWAQLLPAMLKPLGYRSYHSGKWHIDGKPVASGFDRSYQLEDAGRYFSPRSHLLDDVKLPPVEPGAGYYATVAIADRAVEFLREHAQQHADQPFFQYLAFIAPHFPLHALPEDIDRYRETYKKGWEAVRTERWVRQRNLGLPGGDPSAPERDLGPPYAFPEAMAKLGPNEVNRPVPWDTLTPEQREFQSVKMAIHAAMVDRMDREIGRVLDQIRAMGAMDNTLIIFLSDNGASAEIMVRDDGHDPDAAPGSAASHLCLGPGWANVANTPLRRYKTWTHEGGISTSLIAHWPKGIAARGELRRDPGHVIDIVPTVLAAAGGEAPKTVDGQPVPPPPGKSLLPAFAQDGTVTRDDLWWFHEGHKAVRVGDWKLVASKDTPWELYDLKNDRAETKDLAAAMPEKVQQLEEIWNRRMEEFRQLAMKDLPEPPPEKSPGKKVKIPKSN